MKFPFSFWKAASNGIQIELAMRAINEHRARALLSLSAWPNILFAPDGTLLNGATGIPVTDYPADNIYDSDEIYRDTYNGDPAFTFITSLVNLVRTSITNSLSANWVVNGNPGIEGQSAGGYAFYTSGTLGVPAAATTGTYVTTFDNLKPCIRLLTTLFIDASLLSIVNSEHREGQKFDPGTCAANKTAAKALYDADTYVAFGSPTPFLQYEYADNSNSVELKNQRGKFQTDFTTYNYTGLGTLFIILNFAFSGATVSTSGLNPPVATDSKYHALLNPTLGVIGTSAYYGSDVLDFSIACPGVGTSYNGWQYSSMVASINPTFYHII